jgi:hypothetical protein
MLGMLPVGSRPGDASARLSFLWSVRADGFEAFLDAPLPHWHQQLRLLWPAIERLCRGIGAALSPGAERALLHSPLC